MSKKKPLTQAESADKFLKALNSACWNLLQERGAGEHDDVAEVIAQVFANRAMLLFDDLVVEVADELKARREAYEAELAYSGLTPLDGGTDDLSVAAEPSGNAPA